jgi:hypothetical protein
MPFSIAIIPFSDRPNRPEIMPISNRKVRWKAQRGGDVKRYHKIEAIRKKPAS